MLVGRVGSPYVLWPIRRTRAPWPTTRPSRRPGARTRGRPTASESRRDARTARVVRSVRPGTTRVRPVGRRPTDGRRTRSPTSVQRHLPASSGGRGAARETAAATHVRLPTPRRPGRDRQSASHVRGGRTARKTTRAATFVRRGRGPPEEMRTVRARDATVLVFRASSPGLLADRCKRITLYRIPMSAVPSSTRLEKKKIKNTKRARRK